MAHLPEMTGGAISLPLLRSTDWPVATLTQPSSCWYLSLSMDMLRQAWPLKVTASRLANSLSNSFLSVICSISILDAGSVGTLAASNNPEER
jgi:hypothetical protein